MPKSDAVEERHPDRNAADEERGHASRHGLLRPGEAAVAEEKEETSEDEAGEQLRRADPVAVAVTSGKRPGEEERAGEQVPDCHREEAAAGRGRRWRVR